MPEPEGPSRAVYDHTDEEPRPAGRRRRQVADWGVGEELFDGMPSRRFDRRGEDHRIPRGGVDDGRPTIRIADSGGPPVESIEVLDEEYASREEALRARKRHDAVWAGDEPFADHAPQGRAQPLAEKRDLAEAVDPEPPPRAGGRGRPAEFHSSPTRRRPSRAVHERVGPRPDRIAAWAFVLGLLLILIAIATANI